MALQREHAGPVAIARSADVIFAFVWQVNPAAIDDEIISQIEMCFTSFCRAFLLIFFFFNF